MRDFFNDLHKNAVISCVELILMQFDNTKYHLVVAKLRAYDTTLSESYDRIEYLKITLKEVYENNYSRIINDIKECCGDLLENRDISEFFEILEN